MKRKIGFLLFVLFVFTGVLHAAAIRESYEIYRSRELVLLHTNDMHGALLSSSDQIGYAGISGFIKSVRAENPNVLLLNAGDFNTGSALSNMFSAEPDILAFNIMGYDAVVFGNHEFDGNMEKLNNQIALAEFPFVSSNITTADGSFLGGHQYVIIRFDNFSVGVFGITTLRSRIIASPDSSLVFINELEAARNVVDILRSRENVDIVIALTHMGDVMEADDHVTSIRLAKDIEGIDIVVDGHSHTFFERPRMAGDAWVVSAGERGRGIGYGKITVRERRIASFNWVLASPNVNSPMYDASFFTPDPEVENMLSPYAQRANAALSEVIGEAADAFIFGNRLTRYQETALGNMICDANAWYLRNVSNQEIDFVFHNGGNMRAELPKGTVTQEQILTILPFENYLHVASMTGAQIIELFDFIATIQQGSGGFPQFSGDVRYVIDKTSGNGTIRNLTIGGESVNPERIYRFCTNDYILGGGDGYEIMRQAIDPFNVSLLLSYVVTEYIKTRRVITPALDGRLTVVGGITP
jgi:5'-nucleotidase/UDP-sugar diphosphatase